MVAVGGNQPAYGGSNPRSHRVVCGLEDLEALVNHLEAGGELLRIDRPVDVVYEAGAIADLLVKNDGPAVLFEQPRLADGSI